MYSEKEDPSGEHPSAALAALTVAVGGLFWWGGIWLFGGAGSPFARAVGSSPPLAPLTLFAAVRSVLLVAWLQGLCRYSWQPRDHHTRDSARPSLERDL